jgi:hypothetical protein
MRLILMPSFADTALSLGYDDLDDVDQDAVLLQQGGETEITEVEPGNEFEVPFALDFGDVQTEGTEPLKLMGKDFMDEMEIKQEKHKIRLYPGRYLLHEDGETIFLVKEYDS